MTSSSRPVLVQLFPALRLLLCGSLLLGFGTALSTPIGQDKGRPVTENYYRFLEQLPSMAGKSIVITGCSRGLGYVTAKAIIGKGAMVYLLNRNDNNFEDLRHLSEEHNAPAPILVECDLLDFASVRKAAAQVQELVGDDGIDVLCNNAGIMLQPDQSSVDGYDITASTNVLSHFLLTKELMEPLRLAAQKRGEARIVNMSSASGNGPPAFNPLFFEKRGGNCGGSQASYERYHQSKLGNLIFTSALEERLAESSDYNSNKIKALACTPGVCGTDMFRHATTVMLGKPSSLENVPSPEDGSMAQVKSICDPTVSSGDLWGPARGGKLVKSAMKPPQILIDDPVKDVFWDACEAAVGRFEI